MKVLPEGGTLGDAFASYRRATGKPHPEEKGSVTPPQALLYVWDWFWEIAQGRPMAEGIPMPIPSREILAWSELTSTRLSAFELAAVRALDATYLRIAGEKHL